MKHSMLLLAMFVVGASSVAAAADQRLATATRAFVRPADALAEDQPVSSCMMERLTAATALQNVAESEAEITLTVHDAHIRKHPRAQITATLPDGTVIWEGKSKKRGFNLLNLDATCTLANDLLENLRDARRKTRDSAKE